MAFSIKTAGTIGKDFWLPGTIADALDRDHGRVECVELSRQYLHLSPLVDVA